MSHRLSAVRDADLIVVLADGKRADLTRVEFELLVALAARPGAALSRRKLSDQTAEAMRGGHDRTIDVHISRLRRKLGPSIALETVWGIGYRLVAK